MSDTTQDDAARAAPTEPAHAPNVGPDTQPETRTETAPGAEQDPPQDDAKPDPAKPDARDRAIRQMAFEARETRRQLQQLREQQERANPPDPNAPPSQAELDRIIDQRAQALVEQRENQAKTEAWIARGNADFPDFTERCNQLADMGAGDNPTFMQAVGELPDGHKVLANLAENPAETARILKLPPVRMALELATLSHRIAAAPPPAPKPTSQAPPPIRPIQTTSRAEVRLESLEGDDFLHAWNKKTKGRA